MGYNTYKRESPWFQAPEFSGYFNNSFQPVIFQQKFPVFYSSIFQHPLDDVRCILREVDSIPVNVPKQTFGKALYAFLLRHSIANIRIIPYFRSLPIAFSRLSVGSMMI